MPTMNILFTLIFAAAILLAAAEPPSLTGCTDELVAFSPCLGYVSAAPNNVTDTVTSQCCDAFSKTFDSGAGNCFCYLFERPLILGFPVNASRLSSLPSVCASLNASWTIIIGGSLESICSGSPPLPPLQNESAPMIPLPASGSNESATTSVGSPMKAAKSSPSPLSSAPESVVGSLTPPARTSSAMARISFSKSWFPSGLLASLLVFAQL